MSTARVPELYELKRSLRDKVLFPFLDGKPHEVNEISEAIGVSRQTVSKCLAFFMKDHLITTVGKGVSGSSGGKKPLLYALSSSLYLICVTLWEETFRIHLYNINGDLTDRIVLDAPLPDTPAAAAENIGRLSAMLMEKNKIDPASIRGVCVSVPGWVDRKTNTLVLSTAAMNWGRNISLADLLRPFFADNTMILIESPGKIHSGLFYLDPRFEGRRLLVLSVFHGVSGCLIENGRILNGRHSLIGSLGHMILDPADPEACSCGAHGCLNVLVSPARLREIIRREAEKAPGSPLLPCDQPPSYRQVFEAARSGDPLGRICEDYLARQFAQALRNLVFCFDPDYVLFAGGGFPVDDHFKKLIWDDLGIYNPGRDADHLFDILYDDSDLAERDALAAMMMLRWRMLNSSNVYLNLDTDRFHGAEDAE